MITLQSKQEYDIRLPGGIVKSRYYAEGTLPHMGLNYNTFNFTETLYVLNPEEITNDDPNGPATVTVYHKQLYKHKKHSYSITEVEQLFAAYGSDIKTTEGFKNGLISNFATVFAAVIKGNKVFGFDTDWEVKV